MKKKIVAIGLATILCLSMPLTSFAASSSKDSNSSMSTADSTASFGADVEQAKAGATVSSKSITVEIVGTNGAVSNASLETVVTYATTLITASTVATPENVVAAVTDLMTSVVSPQFTTAVQTLAATKGSAMEVNSLGTIKTAASAKDPYGNIIASAGVLKDVSSSSIILLMSVNADGTIEYVEGVIDPISGAVVGAFKGSPSVITVLVLE